MQVGIHIDGELADAVAAGVMACGWKAVRRSPVYTKGQTEAFDLVVVDGLHGKRQDMLDDYRANDVSVIVIDLGYFRDADQYQVSLNGLNRPVQTDCISDRFDRLGLTVTESGGDPKGYVLVAAQRPDDASHGLSAKAYQAWLAAQDGNVRPHPLERESDTTLADDLAGARLLKTYCSNAGIEALLAGVPAVAEAPERAAWGELSGETLPSIAERKKLFYRLAYSQWALDEIANGDAFRRRFADNRPAEAGDAPKVEIDARGATTEEVAKLAEISKSQKKRLQAQKSPKPKAKRKPRQPQ